VFYGVPEIINRYVQKMQLDLADLSEGLANFGLHLSRDRKTFSHCRHRAQKNSPVNCAFHRMRIQL
jgi:hypothetical protein